MCTYKDIKLIRYENNVVGFKVFDTTTNDLRPLIFSERGYNVSFNEKTGDYIILPEQLRVQYIDFVTNCFDIKNNIEKRWIIGSTHELGIHSYLNTSEIDHKKLWKWSNNIALIVLIELDDIQLISENNIVSRQVIIPNVETYKNIINFFRYSNKHILENEFNINLIFINEYFGDEDFYDVLNMIYEMLNGMLRKNIKRGEDE